MQELIKKWMSMKKTINILIFSLIFASVASAGVYKITREAPAEIQISTSKPCVVDFNFEVTDAKLVQSNSKSAKLELLRKGFLFVPLNTSFSASVVVTARDGGNYVVLLSPGGNQSVFHMEDALQDYDAENTSKIDYESEELDKDLRNIVKAILIQKPLSGFKKTKAHKTVKTEVMDLTRMYRYIGSKYVADYWVIKNKTNRKQDYRSSDFYTKGILGVAPEKYSLQPGASMYVVTILNKYAVYQAER